jgi:hypothetical protein
MQRIWTTFWCGGHHTVAFDTDKNEMSSGTTAHSADSRGAHRLEPGKRFKFKWIATHFCQFQTAYERWTKWEGWLCMLERYSLLFVPNDRLWPSSAEAGNGALWDSRFGKLNVKVWVEGGASRSSNLPRTRKWRVQPVHCHSSGGWNCWHR